MNYGLGCKPDPHDPRDRPLGVLIPTLEPPPYSASVMDSRVRAKNQLGTSSCVGNGGAQGARLGHLKRGTDCPDLSASYLYRGCLNADHETEDIGTHIRRAVQVLQKIGCCSEAARPFSESRLLQPITLAQASDGADRYGLRGYYRIYSGDVDGVKRAIAAGYPVVAGWDVTDAFMRWDGKEPIGVLRDTVRGGHCMCVVGYEGDVFDLLNSWGTGWGLDGHALVTKEWLAGFTDCWALDVKEAS